MNPCIYDYTDSIFEIASEEIFYLVESHNNLLLVTRPEPKDKIVDRMIFSHKQTLERKLAKEGGKFNYYYYERMETMETWGFPDKKELEAILGAEEDYEVGSYANAVFETLKYGHCNVRIKEGKYREPIVFCRKPPTREWQYSLQEEREYLLAEILGDKTG